MEPFEDLLKVGSGGGGGADFGGGCGVYCTVVHIEQQVAVGPGGGSVLEEGSGVEGREYRRQRGSLWRAVRDREGIGGEVADAEAGYM